jgi:hypothetical protein
MTPVASPRVRLSWPLAAALLGASLFAAACQSPPIGSTVMTLARIAVLYVTWSQG